MLLENYRKYMNQSEIILQFPWENKEFYAAWCAQTYYYTSHATRILLFAGTHCPMEKASLYRRFVQHAQEEKGHEVLAQRDAKALGYDVQAIGEFPITQAFYKTQYHNIQHISPESLFGWILFLEGATIHYGNRMRNKIKEANPEFPTNFLEVHVDEDPDHVEKALAMIESFSPENQRQLINNLAWSVDMYTNILRDCERWAKSQKQKKAA